MALQVTVGNRSDSGDKRFHAVEVTVQDSEDPRLTATFGYVIGAFTRPLLLRSIAVGPSAGVPLGKQARLTISGVRDLPLSRWEAAARAHLVQRFSLSEDQVLKVARIGLGAAEEDLRRMADIIGPAKSVERLYPGLEHSDRPADVRRYRSLLHLAEVAQEYRSAQLEGVPDPAAKVARDRAVNPATVRSWLHRARKARLLGPDPGR
ncbi:hypothetical protein JNW88_17080 [Micromonospora sp. ATA32]|nr:hypothetical protein [Micromonospora sp. ATA32]